MTTMAEREPELDDTLAAWVDERAEALDADAGAGAALLARLAAAGLLDAGVPRTRGGDGRGPAAAIGIVARLAERSLAAAFVFWAQRACIECLLHGADPALAGQLLPALLQGTLAGAPGLSNAMKFLGGLDRLRVTATETETEGATTAETGAAAARGVRLSGSVPWATNLHPQGFVALLAAGNAADGSAAVYAVAHDAPGLARAPDLDLGALRGTCTGALRLEGVAVPDVAGAARGRAWCVGLQCGLGHGVARAALRAARAASGGLPGVLALEAAALEAQLDADWRALASGSDDGSLRARPRDLLALRLRAVELADAAVRLELQALGGRALLRERDGGFGRRLREAAFLAVLTPTLVQLKSDLARS